MPHQPPAFFTVLADIVTLFGPLNLIYALIAVNFIAFALFGIDKAQAEAGRWRVRERTLLLWAAIGGTLGAYAGRALFRHKTRKASFSENLRAVAELQLIVLAGLGLWWLWAVGLARG